MYYSALSALFQADFLSQLPLLSYKHFSGQYLSVHSSDQMPVTKLAAQNLQLLSLQWVEPYRQLDASITNLILRTVVQISDWPSLHIHFLHLFLTSDSNKNFFFWKPVLWLQCYVSYVQGVCVRFRGENYKAMPGGPGCWITVRETPFTQHISVTKQSAKLTRNACVVCIAELKFVCMCVPYLCVGVSLILGGSSRALVKGVHESQILLMELLPVHHNGTWNK